MLYIQMPKMELFVGDNSVWSSDLDDSKIELKNNGNVVWSSNEEQKVVIKSCDTAELDYSLKIGDKYLYNKVFNNNTRIHEYLEGTVKSTKGDKIIMENGHSPNNVYLCKTAGGRPNAKSRKQKRRDRKSRRNRRR